MSKNKNSLRRVMALIGLLGAPVAVWPGHAGAQDASSSSSSASSSNDGPPEIMCSTDSITKAYDISYYNTFDLTDGKLATQYGDSIMSAKMIPLSSKFFGGVTAWPGNDDTTSAMDTEGDTTYFIPTTGSFDVSMNGTITDPVYSAFIVLPAAPGAVKAELREARSQTLIASGDAKAEADTLTPSHYSITGSFDSAILPKIRNVALELTIIVDGQPAAKYTYDYRTVPWQSYQAKQDMLFKNAGGIILNDDGTTNMDGCESDDAGCFFTTAAAGTVGLSDDCWELQTLRAFRDGALAKTGVGRALTVRYYDEAPRLVAGINRRMDATRTWLHAYWGYVLPCAILAKIGCHELAVAHYSRLFNHLERLA